MIAQEEHVCRQGDREWAESDETGVWEGTLEGMVAHP